LSFPPKNFFTLLKDHPQYSAKINENLSRRFHYKMVMSRHIFSKDPNIRLKVLMDYFKDTRYVKDKQTEYLVRLIRKQMADLTVLRLEMVIRAIKAIEKRIFLRSGTNKFTIKLKTHL
jgi:CRP-like cAMP-binding protein